MKRVNLLLPLSWLYAVAMRLRNRLYDGGVLRAADIGVPVFSVGNLTVGGTGKTPLVEYIVRHLLERGRRVAVVSRGYKRKSRGVVVVSDGVGLRTDASVGGDEPVQIAAKFPSAIVVVGEKRAEAARRAVALGARTIVMDDGFQHRSLKRSLDIAVIDATHDVRREPVLPAGRLREPISGVRRASLIALSRAGDVAHPEFESEIRRYSTAPVVRFHHRLYEVRNITDGTMVAMESVRTKKFVAFSGIGNHAAFVGDLRRSGFQIVDEMRFADHHGYTETNAAALVARMKAGNANGCMTTEKDAVRLRSQPIVIERLAAGEMYYVTIVVEFVEGEDLLRTLLDEGKEREEF